MHIDFTPDPRRYPFNSRWFPSSHGTVHYIDEGAGPVLLFCHGAPTWSFLYRDVVATLRDRFRCIAVDQLGFGLSQRPPGFGYTIAEHAAVLGELVDHLRLDPVILVGHDWGGPIGLAALAERPDRIGGIVLCNTVFWPVRELPNRLFGTVMNSRPMRRRIVEQNLLVEQFLLRELGNRLDDDDAAHYRGVQPDAAARVGLGATPSQIRDAAPLLADLERRVPDLFGDTPALALWGMRDPVFRPRSCLPRLRAALRELRIVELRDTGHFVPEEAPDRLALEIASTFGRPAG